MLSNTIERRLFVATVAILALVPAITGAAGLILGPRFLGLPQPWPVDLASHFRFLSGIFLAMGLAWWSCLLNLEAVCSAS